MPENTRMSQRSDRVARIGNLISNFAVTLFFLLICIFFSQYSRAQDVQVLATVDRNEVGVGDSFTFKITVTSDSSVSVESPRLGNIQGLELINSWTGQQTQSIFSGGSFQVINAKEFNFMFAASQAGKVTIPSAQVVVEGKSYSTEPIMIDVSASSAGNQPPTQVDPMFDHLDQMDQLFNQLLQRRFGGNPGQPLQDDSPVNPKEAFFIRAEADKSKAYVGEQVTASWYLYTRGQITDIDTLKYPTLRGFWKEELEMATRLDFEQAVINGIPYQRALLVSYALFPIKSGKAQIDSYKAKCTVVTPGNFGFGRPYQFTKSSRPLELQVIDVPTASRPSDFTGAVGSFNIKAELDRTQVPAHQPVTWTIRVEGRGNAKLIDLPALNLPPNLELYDQTSDSKFHKNGTSFKQFEVLLIPRESGEIEIPSIQLSVFNPDKESFETISTKAMKLQVSEGQRTDQVPMASGKENQPSPKTSAPFQYPFFSSLETAGTGAAVPSFVWWSLFSLSGISVLLHAAMALGRTKRKETLHQVLNSRLKKLTKLLNQNDWRGFGAELSNSTYKILGLVVGSQAASKELESLLRDGPPSLRREMGEELRKFLSEVEAVAFAPEEIAKGSASKENLLRLKANFERLMKSAIQKVEED